MKIFTTLFGCLLIITSLFLFSNGFLESLDFANLVSMNWTNSTVYSSNPILPFLETTHQTKVYTIIIDAGSTGTRIHVYKFRYYQNQSFPYVLVDEVFEEVKPGLSSYSRRPSDCRPGLLRLLQAAKRKIPQSLWRHTWLRLRATAGLRLLGKTEAQNLLNEAEETLRLSGFRMGPNAVAILSGREEGALAWVTVSFLQNHHALATLDLGGASIQLTCPNMSSLSLQKSARSTEDGLYSRSYLGLGLMSARFAILTADMELTPQVTEIQSRCVPVGYQGHWKFGGDRYTVHSIASRNESMFTECHRLSKRLVTEHNPIDSSPIVSSQHQLQQFYLFSYFYDRLKDSGLKPETLSNATAQLYRDVALSVCSHDNKILVRKPFLCLDLTYIYSLLNDGFKFGDTRLTLTKRINNIELGWALGAAFAQLHETEKV